MADEVILNNISDDSNSKEYIANELMPSVFHDIPLTALNIGSFSIIREYMSQVMEQLGFTSSFYFNESFITKAVLADSIYSEAAIFNIGYAFATASACTIMMEIRLDDIYKNAEINVDTGLYEFILDRDTKINLSNGNVYSFDYDILIQYKNIATSSVTSSTPAWNVQYTNMNDANVVATNKVPYIIYRVTDNWLCIFTVVSEYQRETHTIVNNMSNGVPNTDVTFSINDHLAGFDVKYIDGNGNEQWLNRDHILPIHAVVRDQEPYIHYIMDDPRTIRFMFQLCGNKYFIPTLNSRFEITLYTCHGKSANFSSWSDSDQPNIISESSRYPNNGNILKAAFIESASVGGTDIGNTETVRRETIEAYNTANVISTDHDIEEWFKTFFFKNILYPFFYKRRDDPWGRIWAGFIALTDDDDTVFRTNTLHGVIPYRILYNNNDNTVTNNEIIIPPGWLWVYENPEANRYTIKPYLASDRLIVENAKSLQTIPDRFVFANPFGIRIQKDPFAIGYFNPWVNQMSTVSRLYIENYNTNLPDDESAVYHGTPLQCRVERTYLENYYKFITYIGTNVSEWIDGVPFTKYVRQNAAPPTFVNAMWNYFVQPMDLYSSDIPLIPLTINDNGYIPFNPEATYLCVSTKNRISDTEWNLNNIWIEDNSETDAKLIQIPITGDIERLYGLDSIWGDSSIVEAISPTGSSNITITGLDANDPVSFDRVTTQQYYEMRMKDSTELGDVDSIVVSSATETTLTKYGESNTLWRIGNHYSTTPIYINIYFKNSNEDGTISKVYQIRNAADVYIPYTPERTANGEYIFKLNSVGPSGIILYADMKPSAIEGAVDHYRVKFSDIPSNNALFYIGNKILPMYKNNLRVVLHAYIDGTETGWVEMQPVRRDSSTTFLFDVSAYPLNDLVDVDNRIQIASTTNGGGSWHATTSGAYVNLDASNPELRISILIRTNDVTYDPGLELDDSFIGFRVVDQYSIDDISLVQELKEMRSVVRWHESSEPSEKDIEAYDAMYALGIYDASRNNFFTIQKFCYEIYSTQESEYSITDIKNYCTDMCDAIDQLVETYEFELSDSLQFIYDLTKNISINASQNDDIISILQSYGGDYQNADWGVAYTLYSSYESTVEETFESKGVNNGMEIQLMPVVKSTLMTSESFARFVSAFTQVHTAIEPVIFKRLEGNNYLDCKLIASYGLPHSYCSDIDKSLPTEFWPDLDVQIEFDVKLYNTALTMNTLNELRVMIKSYFNRLTSIHTPIDVISMDNNIYISQLIQQMESHDNVAYLKFKGWYTSEKGISDGNYMNADYQAIVQKWDALEDMPTDELERYVPEMFILEDENIVLNPI